MEGNQHKVLVCDNLRKEYFNAKSEKIIALNDVSFDLFAGEIVGVIGRNGSGKSTLLKVLSKITGVTDGSISYEGKLTSIIEIGTGFHPDLTGKENVQMSGQLLGFRTDKSCVYNAIVAFSGLEDFMDMPVKHYSSGMYLRLAFSIAFHSKIDILLLDVVLAVGDADFRRKCHNKIRELRTTGTSIIFVSHQMEPIIEFCNRCLWLDNGKCQMIGKPLDVVEAYLDSTLNQNGKIRGERSSKEEGVVDLAQFDSEFLSIKKFEIYAEGKSINDPITIEDTIILELECTKFLDEDSFEIVYTLTNLNNVRVLTDSYGLRPNYEPKALKTGTYNVRCVIPGNLLSRGVYEVSLMLGRSKKFVKESHGLKRFKVHTIEGAEYALEISTIIRPQLDWTIELIV